MAKKAKSNISCAGIVYEMGKVYKDADVAHLDQNDFETVEDTDAEVVAPREGLVGDVDTAPKADATTDENLNESSSATQSDEQTTPNAETTSANTDADVLE